jgi:hypothetical protein
MSECMNVSAEDESSAKRVITVVYSPVKALKELKMRLRQRMLSPYHGFTQNAV